jgi:SWI/SNF-related matrix-associated actin-dependent regulator of chromatin subfamily A containing DEAD/H box 1
MHDLDFNPENDRQAEDRSHRIGQTKEVKVFKLVTLDSVDEDIFEVGERKSRLTEAVLNDNVPVPTEDEDDAEKGKGKGKKKSNEGDEAFGDIGSIGRILQKAMQRLSKSK